MNVKITEPLLREHLARRLATSGLQLEAVLADPSIASRGDGAGESLEAIVVLSDIDWVAVITGAIAFVRGLDESLRRSWLQQFTRTRFLAGNPARLRERFRFDQLSSDDAIGWIRPAAADEHLPIKRLLKPLRTAGAASQLPPELVVPGASCRRRLKLRMATAGLLLEQYLIHLHHTISEAAIEGHLSPDADDEVRLVNEQTIEETANEPLYLRVHANATPDPRLHLYAALERDDDV
jgi:hypothetical protein